MILPFRPFSIRHAFRRFSTDSHGNIAVIFAIVLVPLVSFVGAAIDYSRFSRAKSAMQSAADSATLMLSKDLSNGTITSAQVTSKAQAYFSALYRNTDVAAVAISATYTPQDSTGSSTVVVTGTGSMPTTFMKIAGFESLGLSTGSTATWGGTRMRVAIALDVTGSMNDDGKLAAMQKAAKGLIDALFAIAKTSDDVYVSIVPFAEMVSVGTASKNASWTDWSDWDENNGVCSRTQYTTKTSCQSRGRTWTASSRDNWAGCVTDRDQPYDTTSAAPTNASTDFPAAQAGPSGSYACPAQLLPMTSVFTSRGTDTSTDPSTIKGKINSLVAGGGTNQPIGMAWAWQSLRTGDPLNTPAKDANFQYTDAIILLSDGLNTIDRWYGNGRDPSPDVDARQRMLCDNIKTPASGAKAPRMFTIQVNTGGDPESAVLKYCADAGNFYPTSTTAGIAGAFEAIGTSLTKLRVAR